MRVVVFLAGIVNACCAVDVPLKSARDIADVSIAFDDEVCLLHLHQQVLTDARTDRLLYDGSPELDGYAWQTEATSSFANPLADAHDGHFVNDINSVQNGEDFRTQVDEAQRRLDALDVQLGGITENSESLQKPRFNSARALPLLHRGSRASPELVQSSNERAPSELYNSSKLLDRKFAQLMQIDTDLDGKLDRLERLEILQQAQFAGKSSAQEILQLPHVINKYMTYVLLSCAGLCCLSGICHHMYSCIKKISNHGIHDEEAKAHDITHSLEHHCENCCAMIFGCDLAVLTALNGVCICMFLILAGLWELGIVQPYMGYLFLVVTLCMGLISCISAVLSWCLKTAKKKVEEVHNDVKKVVAFFEGTIGKAEKELAAYAKKSEAEVADEGRELRQACLKPCGRH